MPRQFPRPLPLLVLLATLPAAAWGQRLLDWRGASTATSLADAGRAAAVAPRPWLQIEREGEMQLAWVANPLGGPVQVRLRGEAVEGYRGMPALPVEAVLAPGQRRVLARFYPSGAHATALRLVVDAVPGATTGRADDSVYRLPFADAPVRIDQGFGGAFSHRDPANRYALDFALPEGTPVTAARDGVVMEATADFHGAGLDREYFGGRANLVRILHADGSMAVYAHLAPETAGVRVGQRVRAGERIGRSGNTGLSTGPHLHFAVQLNRGMQLVSVPFRMAGPLGELRFPRQD